MTATGSSADDSPAAYGIAFSASGATIRNNFVTVNNSAIRSDGGGTGSIDHAQRSRAPVFGPHEHLRRHPADQRREQRADRREPGARSARRRHRARLRRRDRRVHERAGHEQHRAEQRLRFGLDARRPSGSAWSRYNYTGSNVVFARNRVLSNGGPGLVVLNASGTTRQPEQLQLERRRPANSGLAIDLDPNTRDPNSLGTPNGVTINDANDADTGPNGLLNYPGHHLGDHRQRRAVAHRLRAAGQRDRAVHRAGGSERLRRRTHLSGDAHRRRRRRPERDDRHLRPGGDQRLAAGNRHDQSLRVPHGRFRPA